MENTNWIILASKDRGINYGVGTFIKQLSQEMVKWGNVNVYILELGITKSNFFNIRKQDQITIFEIPVARNKTGVDTRKNQEKLAENIAQVISQYISSDANNVIHMNYLFQYFIATSLKESLKGKVIFTQHVFTIEQKLQDNYFDTESQTYNSVDKIITVTKHGKNHLINKGVNPDKIEVVYNGIDPELFKRGKSNGIKGKYKIPEEEKIILYSGRIDHIKGLNYLCLAMEGLIEKYPDCRLVVAGDGDLDSLQKAAHKFSSKISCIGFVPFEDVVAFYHEADIGVIPSLEEHCSYVALEMLHCGLPVVASKLGGLKEIFVHNENAFLAETVSDKTNRFGIAPRVDELQNYMYELLCDKSIRSRFSNDAAKRANKMFTTKTMINHYLKIVKNLNQNAQEE